VGIIGAGVSGLTAAIAARRAGTQVIVFDQLDRPGAKLRASGGGRGNLTNTLPLDEFVQRFGPRERFVQPALNTLPPERLRGLFSELGVATQSLDDFHVYPVSNRAEDLLRALIAECERLGVETHTSTRITSLGIEDGAVTAVATEGERSPVGSVIVATGGAGYPRLVGTGDGYKLAAQVGHTVVTPVPALTGLVSVQDWPRSCAGVTLRDTRVWIDIAKWRRQPTEGSLIFTHEGVSGPAILDVSGRVARLLLDRPVVPLRVNLTPGISSSLWLDRIEGWYRREGGKAIQSLLARTIPRSFAAVVCGIAGLDHISRAAHLDRAARERLVETLTGVPLEICGTEGFAKAMVTSGGVTATEINPRTMMSRLVRGLYFAGEVIDVEGPSGGFNLQWAFSSGWLAGTCAAK
jgi:hypothetical protein